MNKIASSSTLREGPCSPFSPLLGSLYISLSLSIEKKNVLVGSGLTELGQDLGLATHLRDFTSLIRSFNPIGLGPGGADSHSLC